MPTVSIIIPIYNVAEYLEECISSACNQEYKEIEIILVDDGSTDESSKICDEWSKRDNRIVVIHKKNGGLSDARNAGLNVANGEYIYFLDGDDYIKRNLLSTIVKQIEKGYDVVSFRYCSLLEDNTIRECGYKTGDIVLENENDTLNFLTCELLKYKYGWEAWSRIFRKSIIDEYNIRYADNRIIFAEDMYFSLCYYACCKKIKSIPDVLYYYRIRNSSIMQTNKKSNFNKMVNLAKEVLDFYKRHNFNVLVKNYSIIFMYIFNNAVIKFLSKNSGDVRKLRSELVSDVKDITFFYDNIIILPRYKEILERNEGDFEAKRILFLYEYLKGGSFVVYKTKRLIAKIVRKTRGKLKKNE